MTNTRSRSNWAKNTKRARKLRRWCVCGRIVYVWSCTVTINTRCCSFGRNSHRRTTNWKRLRAKSTSRRTKVFSFLNRALNCDFGVIAWHDVLYSCMVMFRIVETTARMCTNVFWIRVSRWNRHVCCCESKMLSQKAKTKLMATCLMTKSLLRPTTTMKCLAQLHPLASQLHRNEFFLTVCYFALIDSNRKPKKKENAKRVTAEEFYTGDGYYRVAHRRCFILCKNANKTVVAARVQRRSDWSRICKRLQTKTRRNSYETHWLVFRPFVALFNCRFFNFRDVSNKATLWKLFSFVFSFPFLSDEVETVDDNLYVWRAKLFDFDGDLAKDMKKFNKPVRTHSAFWFFDHIMRSGRSMWLWRCDSAKIIRSRRRSFASSSRASLSVSNPLLLLLYCGEKIGTTFSEI